MNKKPFFHPKFPEAVKLQFFFVKGTFYMFNSIKNDFDPDLQGMNNALLKFLLIAKNLAQV